MKWGHIIFWCRKQSFPIIIELIVSSQSISKVKRIVSKVIRTSFVISFLLYSFFHFKRILIAFCYQMRSTLYFIPIPLVVRKLFHLSFIKCFMKSFGQKDSFGEHWRLTFFHWLKSTHQSLFLISFLKVWLLIIISSKLIFDVLELLVSKLFQNILLFKISRLSSTSN